jgi:protoporphyrin/coproporphyrin ferrochelatase
VSNELPYDAIFFVSFGGPEGPDDVIPFMENVTRGRGIPRERLTEVSAHYSLFGGVSPINGQNRALIAALETELKRKGLDLPVYWGNRNWAPFLTDALESMRTDGVKRALAFVTSAFSSYSGCRQYREGIEAARSVVGEGSPIVDKLRVFYNHPGFIEPMVDNTMTALGAMRDRGITNPEIAFTAHSVPMSMAVSSDYVIQLRETARLIEDAVVRRTGQRFRTDLVFQSRSGAPGTPWLEPDICDHLAARHADGAAGIVMVPIGFISDHMEVVYDLDTQARAKAKGLRLPIERAATVGTDGRFVAMIRALIEERIATEQGLNPKRVCIGTRPANHDVCPLDCCPAPQRPTSGPGAATGSAGGRPGRPTSDGVPNGGAPVV